MTSKESIATFINFHYSYLKLPEHFYQSARPLAALGRESALIAWNSALAEDLGIDRSSLSDHDLAQIFSGNHLLNGTTPIAMAYSGHQFGHFVPLLGDGRAILLGEIYSADGKNLYDLQLKGAGLTPYSRRGDGKSAIGPVIREYILSEAMHALGIPTTRALAAVTSGDEVVRNQTLPGAILARVAQGHIRIGTFEYAALWETRHPKSVRVLTDYTIKRHYPELLQEEEDAARYLLFFKAVAKRQAKLIAQWMGVGFIHGVMNTDNMLVSGETIDYGPCAFMDEFYAEQVLSSIDRSGRYAYGNQAKIAIWNLLVLANALQPLFEKSQKQASDELTIFLSGLQQIFKDEYIAIMRRKLGIYDDCREHHQKGQDEQLISDWLSYLQKQHLDFTNSFRNFHQLVMNMEDHEFYNRWCKRVNDQPLSLSEIACKMNQVNPAYIPRNHLIEQAIAEATSQVQMKTFNDLNFLLKTPFQERSGYEIYQQLPLESQRVRTTFCGT